METSLPTGNRAGTDSPRRKRAGRKRKQDRITWAAYEDHIRELYLVKRHSLRQVQDHMERYHRFPRVDSRAYEHALQRFGIRTNIPKPVMRYILTCLESQRQRGIDAIVLWCGQVVTPARLDRARRQHDSQPPGDAETLWAGLNQRDRDDLRITQPKPGPSTDADAGSHEAAELQPSELADSPHLEPEDDPKFTPREDSASSTAHGDHLEPTELAWLTIGDDAAAWWDWGQYPE